MINLLYTSTCHQPFSLQDLNLLLAECRLKNTFLGITGILLYNQGAFLQVLEGEDLTVRKIYKKIKNDSRHKNVITVNEYAIEKRNYFDWSMAFKEISASDWISLEACIIYSAKDKIYPIAADASTSITALINSFINLSSQT